MGTIRRIQNELKEMNSNPPSNCSAGLINEDNIFSWTATIMGPENTPYHNGVFYLKIDFPADYPFRAPKIMFVTKIYNPREDISAAIFFTQEYDKFIQNLR